MSLISIITQTLKSQYPLPAERSNLRELPPPPTAASHEENAWCSEGGGGGGGGGGSGGGQQRGVRERDRTKERPRVERKREGCTGIAAVGGSGWIEIKVLFS